LARIEKLSHGIDFFNSENGAVRQALQDARSNLALVIAVNGLKDQMLCRELIARPDLTWVQLSNILRTRSTAEAAMTALGKSVGSPSSEVYAVRWKDEVSRDERRPNSGNRYRQYCSSGDSSPESYRKSYDSRRTHASSKGGYRNRSSSRDSRGSYHSNDSYSGYGSSKSNHGELVRNGSNGGSYESRRDASRAGSYEAAPRGRGSQWRGVVCHECGAQGHLARVCPQVRCYRCSGRGHRSGDCGKVVCRRCGRPHHGRSCDGSWSPHRDQSRQQGRYCSSRSDCPSPRKRDESSSYCASSYREDEDESSSVKVMQVAECTDDCNDFVQKLKVNDVDVEFVIDTGADVTVVTEDTIRRLRLRCERPRKVVCRRCGRPHYGGSCDGSWSPHRDQSRQQGRYCSS